MAVYPAPKNFRPERWSISFADPAQGPVPLEEFKAHARYTAPDDDALLMGYLAAATQVIEDMTRRALISRVATFKSSSFPWTADAVIELPGGKLQSVTQIDYVDTDGATQTWDAANYVVDTAWSPGRVSLGYDKSWPTIREWGLPVTITYVSGYGANPGDVPEPLRSAIMILASELAENREETVIGATVQSVPWAARMLAAPFVIHRMS